MEFNAFFMAIAWAYLACALYTALGKPPLVGNDTRLQGGFYLCAFAVFLYVSYNPGVWVLNLLLGIFYSFGAMGSFVGWPQRWSAFWKDNPEEGSAAGQIGMAFLDLAIAICFFMLTL